VEYWNLILFNEHEREDVRAVADAQAFQCSTAPSQVDGKRAPRKDHRSEHQGMWISQKDNCIGCGLRYRLPVQHSQVHTRHQAYVQVFLCTDRVSQGLEPAWHQSPPRLPHFGTKDDMKIPCENQRQNKLRDHLVMRRWREIPGRRGTGVLYVLHDATYAGIYGGLPSNPDHPAAEVLEAPEVAGPRGPGGGRLDVRSSLSGPKAHEDRTRHQGRR